MTRRFSRWPISVALMIATAPAALAQAPLVPDTSMPPPPPPPPPAAAQQAAPAPAALAPAGVAAIVNGEKITKTEVAKEALKAFGAQVVGQMILIKLVNQEAAKQHIVVSPAQVNAKLTDLRAQYATRGGGTLDSLLAQRHLTLASYKQQLATELRVEALVGKTLPPAPGTTKYHIRHLLIATTAVGPGKPHTDAEALAIIAKAQAELKGGAKFVDVANKYTEDPSGQRNGGDLPGVYDASAPFDPVFLKAALALKPGEVTPAPVKSQFGYHLIEVDSTSAAPTPADAKRFADAAAAARTQQIQQAIPPYVQALRGRATIVDYLGDAPTFAPAPPQGPRFRPAPQSAP